MISIPKENILLQRFYCNGPNQRVQMNKSIVIEFTINYKIAVNYYDKSIRGSFTFHNHFSSKLFLWNRLQQPNMIIEMASCLMNISLIYYPSFSSICIVCQLSIRKQVNFVLDERQDLRVRLSIGYHSGYQWAYCHSNFC